MAALLAVAVWDSPRLTQVKDTALDATKADVQGYNEMQVASWLVAVLCSTYTVDAIQEALASAST